MALQRETVIQIELAKYLVTTYPEVLFHSDYGSGLKLNKAQATLQKKLNGGRRGWPDMFIAYTAWNFTYYPEGMLQTANSDGWCSENYGTVDTDYIIDTVDVKFGLFLELKKEGTKIIRDKDAKKILKGDYKLRKKGDWWDLHTEEQAKVLEGLRQRGYRAEFAVGLEEAKKLIDEYLGGE